MVKMNNGVEKCVNDDDNIVNISWSNKSCWYWLPILICSSKLSLNWMKIKTWMNERTNEKKISAYYRKCKQQAKQKTNTNICEQLRFLMLYWFRIQDSDAMRAASEINKAYPNIKTWFKWFRKSWTKIWALSQEVGW